MSKSVEDYRNIVKILKLQLLKIRQENGELSQKLGIVSENETSSFTPKINHYRDCRQPFAKNILSMLSFAHRCECLGISPQMVFRIADKTRDKSVDPDDLSQILRRLKLHMNQNQIALLVNLLKGQSKGDLIYQQYLQCLSAFQINSQKYPQKGNRTYVQLCLLKYGKQSKIKDADVLFKMINQGIDKPYIQFQNLAEYTVKNMKNINQFQLITVFVALDLTSQCQIQKSIFKRQMNKIFSVLEKGVDLDNQLSNITIFQQSKRKKQEKQEKEQKKTEGQRTRERQKPKQQKPQKPKVMDEDFSQQTGQEAAVKKKIPKKQDLKPNNPSKKNINLDAKNSVQIIGQFKKIGLKINDFISTLLSKQNRSIMVKSFTLMDFYQAIKQASNNDSLKKKTVLQLFKLLDTQNNGTIDTQQLIKIWIRSKQVTYSTEVLYTLLYRSLRQIQYLQPLTRFTSLGYIGKNILDPQNFGRAFTQLNLQKEEIETILNSLIGENINIQKFCDNLKSQGKPPSSKIFSKMDSKLYNELKSIIQKINNKKDYRDFRFKKLMRSDDKQNVEQYWNTIYTNQWACFQYCLEIASKLDNFWRDPQFGPSQADPHGIRSIIGNQSNPPPSLPAQQQISWMTFEDLLKLRKINEKVQFLEKQISAADIVQGSLGDCWYVSSLSIIATKQQNVRGYQPKQCKRQIQKILQGVCPLLFKIFTSFGIYVFKYYKKFQPVYVICDDLFPVNSAVNQLLFAKSPNAGTQWVSFLQKSYAKLHHTYSNMISGDISQGLNDLTNALPVKQTINSELLQENKKKIQKLSNQGQLMGCSIAKGQGAGTQAPVTLDGEKCGLFYGHAYSVTDFLSFKTNKKDTFDLMRLRNPWGHGQWVLDWSDTPKDPEYEKLKQYGKDIDQYYKQKIAEAKKDNRAVAKPYTKDGDDGQFLISFQDFNKVYSNLFTGLTNDVFQQNYEGRYIRQEWNDKVPSNVDKLKMPESQTVKFIKNNHQYILQVTQDDTDILMYIIQTDGRLYRGEKYPYKQLCDATIILCFNLGNREKQLTKFDQGKITFTNKLTFQRRREVNLWNKFKKGRYAIIPCKKKSEIKYNEFQFRIYNEKSKKINIKKNQGSYDFKNIDQIQSKRLDQSAVLSLIDIIEKKNTK